MASACGHRAMARGGIELRHGLWYVPEASAGALVVYPHVLADTLTYATPPAPSPPLSPAEGRVQYFTRGRLYSGHAAAHCAHPASERSQCLYLPSVVVFMKAPRSMALMGRAVPPNPHPSGKTGVRLRVGLPSKRRRACRRTCGGSAAAWLLRAFAFNACAACCARTLGCVVCVLLWRRQP